MKFIRCYIENFGKLHQFKVIFKDGITIINQPNGFGKTTLTAFIKAMLYGLPKNNLPLEKNARKRYAPWQGGIYGGYLEFEHNNIVYRIERTFGQTPKQDQYKLFRLNPFGPSKDFSENVGFELLGVSTDNFDKTTYMPQIRWNAVSTAKDLKDQISNIVEACLDIESYEKAIKTLKNQRSELLAYRGKSGLLYKISSELTEVENKLMQAANAKALLLEAKEQLKEHESKIEETKTTLDQLRTEMITKNHSSSQKIISEQYRSLNIQMQKVQKELDTYDIKYPFGIPDNDELQRCNDYIHQLAAADNIIDNSEELSSLSDDFPNQQTIEEYDSVSNKLTNFKYHLDSAYNALHQKKASFASPIIFCILSIISFGVSYVLYQHSMPLYLLIASSSLFCCSLVGFIIFFFRNTKKQKMIHRLKRTVREYNQQVHLLEEHLRNEMENYGLYENDPTVSLTILKKRMREYRFLDNQKKRCLYEARRILDNYQLHDFPTTQETILFLTAERNKCENLLIQEKKLQKQVESLNQYCFDSHNRNDGLFIPSGKDTELIVRLEHLQNEIVTLHKRIALLQQESDSYFMLEDSLNSLKAQREDAERQVERIDKAINHLRAAFESLSISVFAPLKEKFSEYVSSLLEIPIENIFVNEDISISLELSGIHREQHYLSVGELDIVALCMRLAILDVIYPNQKPPLILDDPFVNLDAENMRKVLDVLSKISDSHQIIYLTCHDSRI